MKAYLGEPDTRVWINRVVPLPDRYAPLPAGEWVAAALSSSRRAPEQYSCIDPQKGKSGECTSLATKWKALALNWQNGMLKRSGAEPHQDRDTVNPLPQRHGTETQFKHCLGDIYEDQKHTF